MNLMEIWSGKLQAKLRGMEVHRTCLERHIRYGIAFIKKGETKLSTKLTHVWKDNSPRIQGFQNLRSLIVNGCGSLISLFSYSLAKLLVKLQDIEVTECGGMEAIIANEPNADDEVTMKIIMFPQLKKLKFRNLPNLESFCSRIYTFEESLLKTVEVNNCPKLKTLPPAFQCKLE
ncbi:unnamed protein product [Camellia sinensis]